MTCTPMESIPMKVYYQHRCRGRHTTWSGLAACVWPRAVIYGDGQFAAVACRRHTVTLYASLVEAQARKRGLDRDGCRGDCQHRHEVIALDPAQPDARPPDAVDCRPAAPASPPSTTPGDDDPSMGSRCGRPRVNGKPCMRPQGWGADPGEKYCMDHGGSTARRTAEAARVADCAETFVRLAAKARAGALTDTEQVECEAAARDVLTARGRRSPSGEASADAAVCPPVPRVAGLPVESLGLVAARLFLEAGGEVPDAG